MRIVCLLALAFALVAAPSTAHADDSATRAAKRHYASGDIFLFPSLSETFGNVTLEALASGVPVVAYDYGAAREHMKTTDVGACISQDDADGFIAAAIALADDTPRRMRLRESARAAVEDLDPASVASAFSELLTELAARRAA